MVQILERTATLSELISAFLRSRSRLSPHTQSYYRMILSNFSWYARSQHWPNDLSSITRDHIGEFLDYVATESYRWPCQGRCSYKPAAPATVHHYGRVVKTLFNWAEEEEYLEANPTRRIKLGRRRDKEVEPYSDDEVRAMLSVCDDDAHFRYRYLGIRNKAIISLFVATGLRVEELSLIHMSSLDPRLQQVRVMGKGAKSRVVPISREARKALKHYLELRPPGGDELWKTDDGQPMTLHGVKIMIQRLKVRAGVNSGGGAHRFRHYFATRYLEAGGDLNSLRLLLGHSTLDMVLKYSRYVDVRRALASHDQFDPLEHLYRGQ
jgi:site-specific recombinase XerD